MLTIVRQFYANLREDDAVPQHTLCALGAGYFYDSLLLTLHIINQSNWNFY